LFDLVLAKW